jgi:molybdate transport system substrate-binding protein
VSLTRRTLAGLIALAPTRAWASEGPLVAAASDLTGALPIIAERFRRAGGGPVRLTFGSSGALTRQIEAGAPFEVFLSAEASLARRLAAAGRTQGPGRVYGQGRLVIFARTGSRVRPAGGTAELIRALRDGRIRRLAIANPEHAPYGRAAREALTALGVWRLAEPRLVLGDSAAQAARFAMTGGAEAGLLPLSLALGPELARAGAHAWIDPALHAPLVQTVVLLRGAGQEARAFFDFLASPPARAVLRDFGLAPDGDA